jgi:putative transcriptional regulator
MTMAQAVGLAPGALAAKNKRMARKTPPTSSPPKEQHDPEREPAPPVTPVTGRRRSRRGVPKPWSSAAETSETSLVGQVLIAMPSLTDPRFAHSVIYLCAHTPDGAMGIVLNRPVEKPTFSELLQQLEVGPVPPARSIRMCGGGPVDGARGFVLHSTDWNGEGSMRIDDGTALTASLDVLKAIAAGGGPEDCILALGYAGWGAGQLDAEIKQNTWLTAAPGRELLFDADHATKWRRAMASLKVNPMLLSSAAGRA